MALGCVGDVGDVGGWWCMVDVGCGVWCMGVVGGGGGGRV